MIYPLAYDSWGDEEKQALQKVIDSGRYTMGNEVLEFEKQFAEHYGSKYAVMANSGSSANLLMLTALRYDDRYNLEPDDEVIVPAVSWSTTFFPVHQNNFKLVFVDIDRKTLNLKTSSVIDAITDKTKIIFVVNLLGNPAELDKLVEICNQKNIILIEDNCESLGAKLDNRYCGTWGVMGSFSFFFSHHMQTMEGGMVLTDDLKLYQMMKSIRAHGWLRDLPAENLVCNKLNDPFRDSFRFALPGYCLRPLEMSGAVGQVQLKKVGNQIDQRRKNAIEFKKLFDNVDYITTQLEYGYSSWFGFSILLQGALEGKRDIVIKALTAAGVETRPIVAGNFVNNPACKFINHRTNGSLENAEYVDANGFFIGNDSRDLTDPLSLVKSVITEIYDNQKS
jgi:CDP-6-deoxy-D-xylo-4-hexulose-3-dehydrase